MIKRPALPGNQQLDFITASDADIPVCNQPAGGDAEGRRMYGYAAP